MVRAARHDEQQVGETIQVLHERSRCSLAFGERRDAPLRAPAHRARQVQIRREGRAPGQDETGERRKPLVEPVDPACA